MINIINFIVSNVDEPDRKYETILTLDTIKGIDIPSVGSVVVISNRGYKVESVIWNYDEKKIFVNLRKRRSFK